MLRSRCFETSNESFVYCVLFQYCHVWRLFRFFRWHPCSVDSIGHLGSCGSTLDPQQFNIKPYWLTCVTLSSNIVPVAKKRWDTCLFFNVPSTKNVASNSTPMNRLFFIVTSVTPSSVFSIQPLDVVKRSCLNVVKSSFKFYKFCNL